MREALVSARGWLPDMDLNHDKQIQSLLCYRYTIGQTGAFKVAFRPPASRLQSARGGLQALPPFTLYAG